MRLGLALKVEFYRKWGGSVKDRKFQVFIKKAVGTNANYNNSVHDVAQIFYRGKQLLGVKIKDTLGVGSDLNGLTYFEIGTDDFILIDDRLNRYKYLLKKSFKLLNDICKGIGIGKYGEKLIKDIEELLREEK